MVSTTSFDAFLNVEQNTNKTAKSIVNTINAAEFKIRPTKAESMLNKESTTFA